MMLPCQTYIIKCSAAASRDNGSPVSSHPNGIYLKKPFRLSRGAAFANCKDYSPKPRVPLQLSNRFETITY